MLHPLIRIPVVNRNSVPLEESHFFPKLPTELRLKIYRLAMKQRRLIELEWGPDLSIPTGFGNGSHHWCRVCPRSRKPPALMHVCSESREESQKVYQLRCSTATFPSTTQDFHHNTSGTTRMRT